MTEFTVRDTDGRVIATEGPVTTTRAGDHIGTAEVVVKASDHRAERIEELEAEVAQLRAERAILLATIAERNAGA